MQTFYPWGIDSFAFQFDNHVLTEIKEISRQCQIYYYGLEKKRNGSLVDPSESHEMKESLLNQFDRVADALRQRNPEGSVLLEQPTMKQSLIASLVAQFLDFNYRISHVEYTGSKCEVKSLIKDSQGFSVEVAEAVECLNPADPLLAMGAFCLVSKKAFISAVSQMTELDLAGRLQETLLYSK